jgi:hypothetical protein
MTGFPSITTVKAFNDDVIFRVGHNLHVYTIPHNFHSYSSVNPARLR